MLLRRKQRPSLPRQPHPRLITNPPHGYHPPRPQTRTFFPNSIVKYRHRRIRVPQTDRLQFSLHAHRLPIAPLRCGQVLWVPGLYITRSHKKLVESSFERYLVAWNYSLWDYDRGYAVYWHGGPGSVPKYTERRDWVAVDWGGRRYDHPIGQGVYWVFTLIQSLQKVRV